ncbi:MAG: VOC family protein [Polaromonas sp.]|jgi:catechol 2,3-dioxygenase-like lactoylglutathione lyase family enzyme|nr:VOC family protein [Polaromonas sp.]
MTQINSTTFVLAVRDLEISKAFYIEKLGFDEDFSVDGWAFLSRDVCQVRLGHCPDAVPASECGDHSWFAYLHVSDAQAMYSDLKSRGAPILHDIEDKAWGFREFSVMTSDGHRIVFGQDLEP